MMKDKAKTKIVCRNLPPHLTEEQFKQTIQPHLDDTDLFYYVQGKTKEKSQVRSRAYMNFKTTEGMEKFVRSFTGHVFITSRGREEMVNIEYAPCQKIPKAKKKIDARENTIETDPDYLKFLEELKNPPLVLPSAEEQLDKRLAEDTSVKTTPLLEYIKKKRYMKYNKAQYGAKTRKRGEKNKDKDTQKEKKTQRVRKARKRDKEERKARKSNAEKKDAGEGNAEGKKERGPKDKNEEGDKRNTIWMIRRHLIEPGAITIQARASGDQEGASPSVKQEPQQQPQLQPQPQPQLQPRGRGRAAQLINTNPNVITGSRGGKGSPGKRAGGRGAGSEGKRVYTPKQATATIGNGP